MYVQVKKILAKSKDLFSRPLPPRTASHSSKPFRIPPKLHLVAPRLREANMQIALQFPPRPQSP